MAKKVPAERMAEELKKILNEVADDVYDNLEEITTEFGKKGAKAVRSNAHIAVNGKRYWRHWGYVVEKPTRLSVEATIYNKKEYQLAHLLEHGHETYNQYGGPYRRTPAHPHILEISDELIRDYEKEVMSKL